MLNDSGKSETCLTSAATDGYFVVIPAPGTNPALRYAELTVTIMATVSVTVSTLLVVVGMVLNKKLRTPIDIVFSQVIIGIQMAYAINVPYRLTLQLNAWSLQNMTVCIVMSILGLMGLYIAIITYFTVVVMQMIIVKKGAQVFKSIFTRRTSYLTAAVIWIIAAAASSGSLLGRSGPDVLYAYSPLYDMCGRQPRHSFTMIRTMALGVAVVSIPCFVGIFMFYGAMVILLRRQIKIHQPRIPSKNFFRRNSWIETKLSVKSRERVRKMVVTVLILMTTYLTFLTPMGVMTGLDLGTNCKAIDHSARQIGNIITLAGFILFHPSYILLHSLRRKASYLIVTGKFKELNDI